MSNSDPPLYVTFRIEDRSVLRDVVEVTSSEGDAAKIVTLVDPADDQSEQLSIEVGHLTKKQWEALQVAHDKGHYTSSCGGHLGGIAEELGISKSAVSQRLRAAESKIISAILGTGSDC